jgi:hypothetical protein
MFDHRIRRIHDLSSRRERNFVISGLTALGTALGASAGSALAVGALAAGTAGAAAAGTGYSIYAGERGAAAQKKAMKQQQQAQTEAAAQARSQQRQSEIAMSAANRRKPNIAAIMDNAAEGSMGGPSGTMLTGPMGVNPQDLQLGRSSLLGG